MITNRKDKTIHFMFPRTRLIRVLIAAALAVLVASPTVFADVGADAIILNVVRVDYTDASGNQSFSADAATSVTVSLVEAALDISGRPTGAAPGDTATVPADQTVASGATADYLYALTANANGSDTYDLAITIAATTDVANETISYDLMEPDGTTPILPSNPSDVTLGASVIIGRVGTDTLVFPGGTLDDIVVDDIVVVAGVDYRVAAVTLGSGGSHDHATGTAHSDTGTLTPEQQGQLVLASNANGSATAANFTDAVIGQLAREQMLLRVQIYAEAATVGTDGTVDFNMTIEPDGTPGANTAPFTDVTTTFTAVNLSIEKLVRNVTSGGAFAATATGVTTDVLEYQVTITNAGGDAANVIVTDAVPDYTTLVVTAGNFAAYTDPSSNTGNISESVDDENPDDVSGDHNTGTGDMTFYVGQGQSGTGPSGGTIANGESFEITYRVTID